MVSPSYVAYRMGAAVANAVPSAVGAPVAEATGRLLAPLLVTRRRIVRRNLRRAPPAARSKVSRSSAAVSDTFASYGRYWLELFRLPADARGSVEARVTSVGFEHITQGLERGTGVILALPHLGGFDFAAAWLAGRGLPPAVVVEAVEPPELFEWFADVRRAIGMEVIPLGPDRGHRRDPGPPREPGGVPARRPRHRGRRHGGRVLRRDDHAARGRRRRSRCAPARP